MKLNYLLIVIFLFISTVPLKVHAQEDIIEIIDSKIIKYKKGISLVEVEIQSIPDTVILIKKKAKYISSRGKKNINIRKYLYKTRSKIRINSYDPIKIRFKLRKGKYTIYFYAQSAEYKSQKVLQLQINRKKIKHKSRHKTVKRKTRGKSKNQSVASSRSTGSTKSIWLGAGAGFQTHALAAIDIDSNIDYTAVAMPMMKAGVAIDSLFSLLGFYFQYMSNAAPLPEFTTGQTITGEGNSAFNTIDFQLSLSPSFLKNKKLFGNKLNTSMLVGGQMLATSLLTPIDENNLVMVPVSTTNAVLGLKLDFETKSNNSIKMIGNILYPISGSENFISGFGLMGEIGMYFSMGRNLMIGGAASGSILMYDYNLVDCTITTGSGCPTTGSQMFMTADFEARLYYRF